MFAGYGQKLFVDGQVALLLRQDRQFSETQLQPAGLLGGCEWQATASPYKSAATARAPLSRH